MCSFIITRIRTAAKSAMCISPPTRSHILARLPLDGFSYGGVYENQSGNPNLVKIWQNIWDTVHEDAIVAVDIQSLSSTEMVLSC
jgi:hypothetical protein